MSRDEAVGLIDDATHDLGTRHVDAVAALLEDAGLFDNPRQVALDVLAASYVVAAGHDLNPDD